MGATGVCFALRVESKGQLLCVGCWWYILFLEFLSREVVFIRLIAPKGEIAQEYGALFLT